VVSGALPPEIKPSLHRTIKSLFQNDPRAAHNFGGSGMRNGSMDLEIKSLLRADQPVAPGSDEPAGSPPKNR